MEKRLSLMAAFAPYVLTLARKMSSIARAFLVSSSAPD